MVFGISFQFFFLVFWSCQNFENQNMFMLLLCVPANQGIDASSVPNRNIFFLAFEKRERNTFTIHWMLNVPALPSARARLIEVSIYQTTKTPFPHFPSRKKDYKTYIPQKKIFIACCGGQFPHHDYHKNVIVPTTPLSSSSSGSSFCVSFEHNSPTLPPFKQDHKNIRIQIIVFH